MTATVKDGIILVLTDSRGRGLEKLCSHSEFDSLDVIVKVLPGKDLPSIAKIANELISKFSTTNYYCVISAGICGLTVKAPCEGHRSLRYPTDTREEKIITNKTVINELFSKFGARVNITTIVPASLGKYFATYNPNVKIPECLQNEQLALEEDINKLNDIIVASNKERGVTTISICKKFQSISKKKNRRTNTGTQRRVSEFKDNQLVDGVHYTEHMKTVCFTSILNTAKWDLQSLTSQSASTTTVSSEETSSDSDRDYKRKTRR